MAEAYAALLAGPGIERGLLGPRERPRLWDRHLINCAVLADLVPQSASVADVGSGAGLPGLVLAIRRPDLEITLLEPLLRRATFLEEAVRHLDLDTVEVVRARAEEVHGSRRFDVVTARAVAPLDKLLRWCLPLTTVGGCVLAMKGENAATEAEAVEGLVEGLGGRRPELLRVGDQEIACTTVVRVGDDPDARLRWGSSREGRRGPVPRTKQRRR